jgi:hypothetical protein
MLSQPLRHLLNELVEDLCTKLVIPYNPEGSYTDPRVLEIANALHVMAQRAMNDNGRLRILELEAANQQLKEELNAKRNHPGKASECPESRL